MEFSRQHCRKDGTPFDTIVSLTAVSIVNRRVMQAVVHDISNRKQLEEERIKTAKLEALNLLAGG